MMSYILRMQQEQDHGKRLKRYREAAGLTQRDLAAKISVTHSNINYWENSNKLPKSSFLIPIAKALNISVDELLGEPAPKKNKNLGGKLGEVFKTASELPRRKQQKIADVMEALIVQDAL